MEEQQNDAFGYYPQDFQPQKKDSASSQNVMQNLLGQNDNLLSMLLSGKIKNPLENNPIFNAFSALQKQNQPHQNEKHIDEDFFEEI